MRPEAPASDLRRRLRSFRLSIFVDLRLLAKGLRERLPFAAARRRAEYVLIDHKRLPLETPAVARLRLADIEVHDGLGSFKRPGHPHGVPSPAPSHPPHAAARHLPGPAAAVPRRHRQPHAHHP